MDSDFLDDLMDDVRHWCDFDFRSHIAEKVIASFFLLGCVLIVFGFVSMRGSAGAMNYVLPIYLVGAGALVIIVSLVVGLMIAFFGPSMDRRTKLYKDVHVLRRFAMDDKLVEQEDCQFPDSLGLRPYVQLTTADGRTLVLRCSATAYEFSEPGSSGNAKVQGDRLIEFRRV